MNTDRAWSYADWHAEPDCKVDCFVDAGSANLWVCCTFHRVVAQLEAVAKRVTWAETVQLESMTLLGVLELREGEDAVDPG